MATINVTKSGTLNPALGRIDNDDATTTAYVAGDTLAITAGAKLTINTSTAARKPGTIQIGTGNSGEIYVANASTATPIVVELSADVMDIFVRSDGKFTVRGDWIVCYTGNGAAGQTIDFSNINGVAIDFPPFVMVETGSGTNVWEPFLNIALSSDTGGVAITEAGSGWELGRFFSFNGTTKIATFGNGANGAVIPNGARVRIPNIHFTSGVQATLGSRSQVNPNTGGAIDFEVCSWSDNWDWRSGVFFQANSVRFRDVGIAGGGSFANTLSAYDIDGFYCSLERYAAQANTSQFSTCQGTTSIHRWYSCAKYVTGIYPIYINTPGDFSAGGIDNLHGYVLAPGAGTRRPVALDMLTAPDSAPTTVSNIYAAGGQFLLTNSRNIRIKNLYHSDQVSGAATTSSATGVTGFSVNTNCILETIRMISGGCPSRNVAFVPSSNCVNSAMHDIIYDAGTNLISLVQANGVRSWIANVFSPSAAVTAAVQSGNTALPSRSRISNVVTGGTPTGPDQQQTAVFIEFTSSNGGAQGIAGQPDIRPFRFSPTNTGRTVGAFTIGRFGRENAEDLYTGNDATNYVDRSGHFNIPGNGVSIIIQQPEPIRGLTSFSGATLTTSGTNQNSGATYEFQMRNPSRIGLNPWPAYWTVLSAANLQSELAALTGYDSLVGFDFRLRITTSTAAVGRIFDFASVTGCGANSAFAPTEIGFIQVGASGAVAGSSMMVYKSATPVGFATTGSGSTLIEFPYDFNGVAASYTVKVRKPGYGEIVSNGQTFQAGVTVPVTQTQYVAVNAGTAATITGIAVDGNAKTITVSQARTLAELYAYCQWWSAQVGNMGYDIPLTTTNGSAYSSDYDWTIAAGVALTGAGTMNLGAKTLTMGAVASSAFDWAYASGAKTWTRLALSGLVAGSRVRVYDQTGAAEWHNAVVAGTTLELQREWSGNRTLDVRVAYCVGTSAKLPWNQQAVFTSAGGSVLVSQVDDAVYIANGIDGGAVTEFSADYPNVQIDVNDLDGATTPQRGYAWYQSGQMTAAGIAAYHGAMTAEDQFNYRINVDMKIQNVSALSCVIAGARIYRADGSTIFAAGTGPIQHDPSKAYLAVSDAAAIADAVWNKTLP